METERRYILQKHVFSMLFQAYAPKNRELEFIKEKVHKNFLCRSNAILCRFTTIFGRALRFFTEIILKFSKPYIHWVTQTAAKVVNQEYRQN